MIKYLMLLGLLFCALRDAGYTQPLEIGESKLDAGYQDLYNLQFDEAHKAFGDWEIARPNDPLGPVSDAAAYLFAEFDRLHILNTEFFADDKNFQNQHHLLPDPMSKKQFETDLERTRLLVEEKLSHDPEDSDALFAKVLMFGLHGDYAALVEKRNGAGLSYIKQARSLAERLLAVDPSRYDAYVALGTENYLLSQKPVFVRWFLWLGGAQTNKTKGLQDLRLAAEKGHYLLPYARLLLAVAAIRDHDVNTARGLLQDLAKAYPKNGLYAEELARLH